MYVCICRQITDNQIRDLCRDGVRDVAEVRAKLGVALDCGRCGKTARTIVNEYHSKSSHTTYIDATAL